MGASAGNADHRGLGVFFSRNFTYNTISSLNTLVRYSHSTLITRTMRPAYHPRLSCRILSSTRPQCLVQHSLLRNQPTLRTVSTALSRRAIPSSKTLDLQHTTKRSFGLPSLSSFLPSSPNNGNGNSSPKRVLTATRTLPYTPALLFKVISSVESYSQFLPFLNESTVTARDPVTGYPTQAFLTVGYGPLSETFTSRVDCDPATWTVEARSGAKYGNGKPDGGSGGGAASGLSSFFPGASEGIFEYLSTRWELVPVAGAGAEAAGGPQTKVHLEVRFEFRNQLHATVMGAVEGQMASLMIEAFEKRIRESHTRGQ